MKKRIVIAIALLILFSTITFQIKLQISKFNLKKIHVENNFVLKEKDIKKLLNPIYDKNLIFLKYVEIEKILMQNSLIDSFYIKKQYPQTLKIRLFEKKPIAILVYKKKKYYLSEKIELIKFDDFMNSPELPYIFGDQKNFKDFYENLKRINFPLDLITKYTFFESGRWDLETVNKKIIKLPSNNYEKSLEEYLKIKNKKSFKKYKIFDFRTKNQLIIK